MEKSDNYIHIWNYASYMDLCSYQCLINIFKTHFFCCLKQLAKNKRVQDKLRDEVNKNCDENGQVSFDKLQDMTYLDQVFYETLRMHPALVTSSRMCSEDVDLEYDGKKVTVEKGINVYVPILEVHYDPENYLEPNKFHPERFDDGAMKGYLDRCVLIPFGGGPRYGIFSGVFSIF